MPVSIPRPMRTQALAAATISMALLVLQYIVARPEQDALREFIVVSAIIAAATVLVFGLLVPRVLARGGSPRTALMLSLLGLLLAAVYWSGLPPVLAVGGIVLGRAAGERDGGGLARTATLIGVLALVANLAAVIVDGATS